MNKQFASTVLLAFTLVFSPVSIAVPVDWTIVSDADFSDGGMLTGGFTYDADLDLFTSWNLITTSGSLLDGNRYTNEAPFNDAFTDQVRVDFLLAPNPIEAITHLQIFEFRGPLTNDGGVVGFEGFGEYFDRFNPDIFVSRFGGPGFLIGVPSTVPVPAAAWLFGTALLGFLGFSRRKATA